MASPSFSLWPLRQRIPRCQNSFGVAQCSQNEASLLYVYASWFVCNSIFGTRQLRYISTASRKDKMATLLAAAGCRGLGRKQNEEGPIERTGARES